MSEIDIEVSDEVKEAIVEEIESASNLQMEDGELVTEISPVIRSGITYHARDSVDSPFSVIEGVEAVRELEQ